MRAGGSFLGGMGGAFKISDVEIVRHRGDADEERLKSRGHIQPRAGFFELNTPIYEGDEVELPDPRGGTQVLYAAKVEMHDAGSPRMSHTEVTWGRRPAPRPQVATSHTVYHGPVVQVNGANAQVAWGDGTITQSHQGSQQVAAGLEDLAVALEQALRLLGERAQGQDDVEVGQEAGEDALAEVVKSEPDTKVLKRSLATLRGVLSTFAIKVASSVATAEVDPVVDDLMKRLHLR